MSLKLAKVQLVIIQVTFLLSLITVAPSCNYFQESKRIIEIQAEELVMQIHHLEVIIRDQAGLEGSEVARLSAGDEVVYLGQLSEFTTPISIQGIAFNEPWLKIRTAPKQAGEATKEGWVYAGSVKFSAEGRGEALSQHIIHRRLGNFFGDNAAKMIDTYSKLYHEAETAQEFADMYRMGLELRDTLTVALHQIDVTASPELPDMFWVDDPIPGLVPTVVDGSVFHLFYDYKQLAQKAARTVGKEDDGFINLCFDIYNRDSIEYFYPSWFLKTWEFGGSSLLGEGIHTKILTKMNDQLSESFMFSFHINYFKNLLVQDITAGMEYWRDQDSILKELKGIIKISQTNGFVGVALQEDDFLALQERVKMFEEPELYDLRLNMRDKVQ